MMWSSDLDSLALLAKERHAEMLAEAMQQQQLHSFLPRQERQHRVWQWLRRALQPLPQASTLKPPAGRQPVLHG